MSWEPAAILSGAGLTWITAWALGTMLLRRVPLPLYRQERPVYAALLGSALLSLLVFVCCALEVAAAGVFACIAAASVMAAVLTRTRREPLPSLDPLRRGWKALLAVVGAAFLLLYLANAMAPEVSPDGVRYHLGLVARYLRHRGFPAITTDLYANYSQAAEMLFLFAFAFGRHSAAAVTHLVFLPALAWLMLCYARRHGQPGAGVAAALAVFVCPVVGIDAASAYNDVALAAVLFAVFGLIEIWLEKGGTAPLAAAGLLAGFGYGIKYTAAAGSLYAAAAALWKLRRAPRQLARALATILLCAAVCSAPWMIKNAVTVGNPVSPFFNSLFPNQVVDPQLEAEYRRQLRMYPGIASYSQLPLEVTLRGELLQGLIGPLFLLAPFVLLGLGSARHRRLLGAALLFGAPYALNIGTRFLIPALPPLALAMAAAARFPRTAALVAVLNAALCWPDAVALYAAPAAWRLREIPWEAALRIVPEPIFLERHLGYYGLGHLIDRKVPPGEPVFVLRDYPEAYFSRDIVTASNSTFGRRMRGALWTAIFPDRQPRAMMRFVFPRSPYRGLRVVQTAADREAVWSVTELRLYQGNAPLPAAPSWRIRAYPNGWEAPLAFDNDASTRWSARQRLRPGMFLEVGFPAPVSADSVLLRYVPDQYAARVKLEASADGASWKTIDPEPDQFEAPPPLFLRQMAAQEFLANHVRYLVVSDEDFGKDDFERHPRQWCIADLGEAGHAHLYRFDGCTTSEIDRAGHLLSSAEASSAGK